jgi:hypothetical protein
MPNVPIYQSVDLPAGSGRVIIYDWSANQEYRIENLVRVDASGDLIWRAKLPESTGHDCFVAVIVDGNAISANTWSGYTLTLDPISGKTLTCTFTK